MADTMILPANYFLINHSLNKSNKIFRLVWTQKSNVLDSNNINNSTNLIKRSHSNDYDTMSKALIISSRRLLKGKAQCKSSTISGLLLKDIWKYTYISVKASNTSSSMVCYVIGTESLQISRASSYPLIFTNPLTHSQLHLNHLLLVWNYCVWLFFLWTLSLYCVFNPIQDRGEGGGAPQKVPPPATSFSTVTSANVRIGPKTF